MASLLEQYRISDFLEWNKKKQLILNPEFQRGAVWTPAARTYLIDTILRELPIPKIYIRTKVDIETQSSIREVVDGQQRLRAIIDFAKDKFALSKRADEFQGHKYSSLEDELQEKFLSYPLSVGQLLNATDDDVLEVFARLNSYSVSLNAPEKRHAKFQGDFKWSVRAASRKWVMLWDDFRVVTVRQRVRMLDDSLMAEMFGVLLHGITDGGQDKIGRLYKEKEHAFPEQNAIEENLNKVLDFIVNKIAPNLHDTPILKAPHFLMLFAAIAHVIVGIPEGQMESEDSHMLNLDGTELSDINSTVENLRFLASVLDSDDEPSAYKEFWLASKSSTQRIASRRKRFPVFVRALRPNFL
jgi:hypothetical protein